MRFSFNLLRAAQLFQAPARPSCPLCILVTGVATAQYSAVAEQLAKELGVSCVSSSNYHECDGEPACCCQVEALPVARIADRIAVGYRNDETLVVACRALSREERARFSVYPITITLLMAIHEQEARRRIPEAKQRIADRLLVKGCYPDLVPAVFQECIDEQLPRRLTRDFLDLELHTPGQLINVVDGTRPPHKIVDQFLALLAACNGQQVTVEALDLLLEAPPAPQPVLRRLMAPRGRKKDRS